MDLQDPYFSKKPPPKALSVASDNGAEGWEDRGGGGDSSHHIFDRPSERGERETSSGDRGEARRSSEMDTSEEVITCQVHRLPTLAERVDMFEQDRFVQLSANQHMFTAPRRGWSPHG